MAKEKLYPYAVAQVRMFERNLIDEKTLMRMAEAKTAEEAMRILSETGYCQESMTEKNFESILSSQLEKAYKEILELVPEENFLDVFLYKNDYHNLKVLIKEEISGKSSEKFLIDGGTIDVKTLKNIFLNRSYESLPWEMAQAVKEAFENYAKTSNVREIDTALDKAAFKSMKITADNSGIDFIKNYVTYLSDTTNLKIYLRIRKLGGYFEMFEKMFVEGGELDLTVFRNALNQESLSAGFKGTRYYDICESGMNEGFTAFEKLCDNFIMDYMKNAKYMSLTAEPMAAYIYAKETEVKAIRIVLISLINKIDVSLIKERLRDAYV